MRLLELSGLGEDAVALASSYACCDDDFQVHQ